VVTRIWRLSISDTRYPALLPVTGDACRAFVPVRPRTAQTATGFVATVGNVADDKVTSEGRCPR
jgi:hypothetical protein